MEQIGLDLPGDRRRNTKFSIGDEQGVIFAPAVKRDKEFTVRAWAKALSEVSGQRCIVVGIEAKLGVVVDCTWENITQAEPLDYDQTASAWETEVQFSKEAAILNRKCLVLCVHPDSTSVCYNSSVFVKESIDVIVARFLYIAKTGKAGMPDSEFTHLKNLSMEPSDGESWGMPDETVVSLFKRCVRAHPERIAIVTAEGRNVSFGELDRASDCIASALGPFEKEPQGIELANGKCISTPLVAIVFERTFGMIAAMLGAQKAGWGYVPIECSFPEDRVAYILKDSGVNVIMYDTRSESSAARFSNVATREMELINVDSITMNQPTKLFCGPTPSTTMYVLYTSGSTGVPKGVALSQRAALSALLHMKDSLGTGEADGVYMQATTFVFDLSVSEIYSPLIWGSTMKLAPMDVMRNPGALRTVLESEPRPTWIQSTPSLLRIMTSSNVLESANHRIKHCVVCGELFRQEVAIKAFRQLQQGDATRELYMYNAWGPTEAAVYGTAKCFTSVEEIEAQLHLSIGVPLAYRGVYILQPGTSKLVPLGAKGELCVSGPGLADGYLNRKDQNEKAFVTGIHPVHPEQVLYRCGDLVRWRPDNGELEIFGRTDSQVKIRGFRVELGEVEASLVKYNAKIIGECSVIAKETRDGAVLVAYLTPNHVEKRGLDYGSLPHYMRPSVIMSMDSLPKGQSGKVDRKALPDPFLPPIEKCMDEESWLPVQRKVMEVTRAVTGVMGLGLDDNYFLHGATSLTAVQLGERLNQTFPDVDIPTSLVFDHPNGRAISDSIVKAKNGSVAVDDTSIIVPMYTAGSSNAKNLFLFHPAGGVTYTYFDLIQNLVSASHNEDIPINIYGVQDPYLKDKSCTRYESIAQMCTDYEEAVQKVQPVGPYFFGGHSMGGLLAVECARIVESRGQSVEGLFLLDTAFKLSKPSVTDYIKDAFFGGMGREYFEMKAAVYAEKGSRFRKGVYRTMTRILPTGLKKPKNGKSVVATKSGVGLEVQKKQHPSVERTVAGSPAVHAKNILVLVQQHLDLMVKHGPPLGAQSVEHPTPPGGRLQSTIRLYSCHSAKDPKKKSEITAW
eukprot:CAMPEP_0203757784 /NCGR_PEP_ID=MMETSP0098-20131031/10684_1 /ASSEMBLY_ACC=CAM_ASM_000208 /TAXON_ID=96639 /ORGANISM=" , Strain NY0313808BC1" /LENGTH=1073 /DNA_ID=CAMNT_0050650017 /DNA_START=3662 /DNA_END=6880 /DNA_ORIENTATION=+